MTHSSHIIASESIDNQAIREGRAINRLRELTARPRPRPFYASAPIHVKPVVRLRGAR